MLSYKLIKKYPLSMDVGTVVKEVTGGYMSDNLIFFHKEYIENYPEFWEEIKEPEFQILAVKTSVRVSLTAENTSTEIYKVLRLSDNTIFSIGDKVFETITGKKDNWIIKEFSTKDDRCFSCGININNIEHYKKPLFITENGVDIFENDTVHWVKLYGEFKYLYPLRFIKEHLMMDFISGYRVFSTEKAAKDWIEMNKPQFSLKDIKKASMGLINLEDIAGLVYKLKLK